MGEPARRDYHDGMSDVQGSDLAGRLAAYPFGYLLTVTAGGEAHAVAVQPRLVDGLVHLDGVGTHSIANLAERPTISLIHPPADFDGYTLIVNGTARRTGDSTVEVEPTRAVLHRPHALEHAGAGAGGCGSDCVPLDL